MPLIVEGLKFVIRVALVADQEMITGLGLVDNRFRLLPEKTPFVGDVNFRQVSQSLQEKTDSAIHGGINGATDDAKPRFGDDVGQIQAIDPRLGHRSLAIRTPTVSSLNHNPSVTHNGDMKRSMSCPSLKRIFERLHEDLSTPRDLTNSYLSPEVGASVRADSSGLLSHGSRDPLASGPRLNASGVQAGFGGVLNHD